MNKTLIEEPSALVIQLYQSLHDYGIDWTWQQKDERVDSGKKYDKLPLVGLEEWWVGGT